MLDRSDYNHRRRRKCGDEQRKGTHGSTQLSVRLSFCKGQAKEDVGGALEGGHRAARWHRPKVTAIGSAESSERASYPPRGPQNPRPKFSIHSNQGKRRPEATVTFGSFVSEQFEPIAMPTFKFSTQQGYHSILRKHLIPQFGYQRLGEFNRSEIQRFILGKIQAGYSWEMANRIHDLLSKVLGTAVEWNYLSENPARGIHLPERTVKHPRTPLSVEETSQAARCPWRTGEDHRTSGGVCRAPHRRDLGSPVGPRRLRPGDHSDRGELLQGKIWNTENQI